jgi:hypothetical protein
MLAQTVTNRYEDFVAMHINTTLGGQSEFMHELERSFNAIAHDLGTNMNTFKGPETMLAMMLSNPFSASLSSIMQNHGPDQILPFHRSVSMALTPIAFC